MSEKFSGAPKSVQAKELFKKVEDFRNREEDHDVSPLSDVSKNISEVTGDGLTVFGTPKENVYIKEDIHNN